MNRLLEILAMALGGCSLFAVCFLGFASMAGVPMHDVAVIGRFFPEPEAPPEEHAAVESAPAEPGEPSDQEVLAASLGALGAWSLTPPFTAQELKGLADELKLKRLQLEQGLRDQNERAKELDSREAMLVEQFQALEDLRARLEAFEQELQLRSQEVEREETAAGVQEDRKWKNLADLFSGLDAEEAGRRLTAYPPAEATKILLRLEQDLALEILNT